MAVSIEGVDKLVRNLNAMPTRVYGELLDELDEIGDDLEAKSVPLAPVDTGALRGSADHEVTGTTNTITMEMGFYGLPYIIPQHEKGWVNYMGREGPKDIERYHRGGGEKFLERPWMANLNRYKSGIREAVERGLRG